MYKNNNEYLPEVTDTEKTTTLEINTYLKSNRHKNAQPVKENSYLDN